MNKLEIQSYLKRDKELFKKFDIEYVINNSSKITVNNIYNLKFLKFNYLDLYEIILLY